MPISQQYHQNLVHYFRKEVNFNDPNLSSGALIGRLPAGAQITQAIARVKTPFNAGTTNVITIGANPVTYDNVMGSADINEAVAGTYSAPALGLLDAVAETDLFVRYVQTGTAASAGKAILHIAYTVNNG